MVFLPALFGGLLNKEDSYGSIISRYDGKYYTSWRCIKGGPSDLGTKPLQKY